jgi:hypothetical protein
MVCSSNTFRSIVFLAISFIAEGCSHAPSRPPDPMPDLTRALHKIAELSPDPCDPPYGREKDWHSANIESDIFHAAAARVVEELNAESSSSKPPHERAMEALKKVEILSARINAAWPEENRFHFKVLDLIPALVITLSIHTDETYFVFGIPEKDGEYRPNKRWRLVGENSDYLEHESPHSSVDLYPLHRGPSGHARFLASFARVGCAGSSGIAYDAREWDPQRMGRLDQFINQTGASGMDEAPEFPSTGKLKYEGSMITLPYCWFSVIDTWDNPSLCAADTYDISGDVVQFHDRMYNRPDLAPIAKAIEFAKQRDYPAVLGYCASSKVAREMVRDIPSSFIWAGALQVTPKGKDKKHIELGDSVELSFDIKKINGHWKIVSMTSNY